ncbi:MAG: hypothetical protein ACI8WB_002751 [Phenylobacterium sp.]|jgi:hypothetical protein
MKNNKVWSFFTVAKVAARSKLIRQCSLIKGKSAVKNDHKNSP